VSLSMDALTTADLVVAARVVQTAGGEPSPRKVFAATKRRKRLLTPRVLPPPPAVVS
jgi:hypothetical protein